MMACAEEISERFAEIFKKHNWKWNVGEKAHAPSSQEIEEAIEGLQRDMMNFKTNRAGTGRIEVFTKGNETFVSIEKGPTLKLGGC